MNGSKEADLVTAVLLYAMRCLAEGDQHALREMNFGPKEIAALEDLGLEDLYRAASLKAHCLKIELNRLVYWPMITHVQRERRSEMLQRALIRAGAPREMMQRLFGLGGREYGRLRRLLATETIIGRPANPDDAIADAVWQAWTQRVKEAAHSQLEPDAYLALQAETGASLRTIWQLTERWAAYGDPGEEPTGSAEETAPPARKARS